MSGERESPAVAADGRRLSVVLPAYNEEANIATAIAEATAAVEPLFADHEIIVVDDGSSDRHGRASSRSSARADDPRVRVIRHGRNRGYGEALRTGFLASRLDFVFFTDADLQFDITELERFMPFLGTVDVVAGYRVNRQDTVDAAAERLRLEHPGAGPVLRARARHRLRVQAVRPARADAVDIESVGRDGEHRADGQARPPRLRAWSRSASPTGRARPGEARGASPAVIATAFREVLSMRRRLSALDGHEL